MAERLHQAGRDRGNALGCQEALGTCFRDYIFPSSSAEMLCARPGAKLTAPPTSPGHVLASGYIPGIAERLCISFSG